MFHWVEHTGEVELEVEAATREAVYAEAAVALGELLSDVDSGDRVTWAVEVAAADDASLLVEWLNELVFLSEAEAFVPEQAASVELADGRVRGELEGHAGAAKGLVKAVTYHRLSFEPGAGGVGWRARVVLDV